MSELINAPTRQNQVFGEFAVACSRRRAVKSSGRRRRGPSGPPRSAQHDVNQQGLLL
jgi:hypothetical protein